MGYGDNIVDCGQCQGQNRHTKSSEKREESMERWKPCKATGNGDMTRQQKNASHQAHVKGTSEHQSRKTACAVRARRKFVSHAQQIPGIWESVHA